MDINDVPQDSQDFKGKGKVTKLVYAVGKDGKYTGVSSAGWAPEHQATRQAWDAIEEDLAETERLVKEGRLSPVAYFMKKRLMDLPLLARYTGKWTWQVKRHMKPAVFRKLRPEMLQKYAAIFDISVAELTGYGKQ